MFVVGLTGGIASGKTTVARQFAELGADVIDTDDIAREVVAPGSEGLAAVVAEFGTPVLGADGTLDRAALRERIFTDEPARERLEALLHPRIGDRARTRIEASAGPYVLLVVPLLVEAGWHRWVQRVLVVDVDEAEQMRRLCARDGYTEAQARAALSAQTERQRRLAHADDVLDNRGSAAQLAAQARTLHQRYLDLANGH